VNALDKTFECSTGDVESTVPINDAHKDLGCTSPKDTEDFLNACKRGEIINVTACYYDGNETQLFLCTDVLGRSFFQTIPEIDNFFCLTDQHRDRIKERCKLGWR
jgi:hypothetical protein